MSTLLNLGYKLIEHLPLTSSQKWCLREMTNVKRPGWCTVEFFVKTQTPMDERVMKEATGYVVNKFESLRVKIISRDGEWIQEIYPYAEANPYAAYDLSRYNDARRATEIKKLCSKERDWLLPSRGNLIKILFFKFSENEGRIWFCMHHVISDFMSCVILASDFMSVYNSIKQGRDLKWQTSKEYRKWLYLVDGYCRDVLLPSELDYWVSFPWSKSTILPSDYPNKFSSDELILDAMTNKKMITSFRADIYWVDQDVTQQLFSKAGTNLENMLIAVFFLAVVNNRKMDWLDMNVCNSGRNILPAEYGINVSDLLGFLAISRVVMLERPSSGDAWMDIQNTIEQIHNIPNGGMGFYLITDYIKNEQLRNSYSGFRRPCFVFFNYLGRLDSNFGNGHYEMVEEDTGADAYAGEIQNNLLECFVGIREKKLFCKLTYSEEYFTTDTIDDMARAMISMFTAIIDGALTEKAVAL